MTASVHAHLNALKKRHADLEGQICEARKHPSLGDIVLRRLKLEKLRVKEEIEGIA